MKKRRARMGLISLTLPLQSAMPVFAADNGMAVTAPHSKALPFLIAACVLLAAVIVAALLLVRRKKDAPAQASGPVITMQAEVYTGRRLDEGELSIKDRLTVGSGQECDLRFAPEDMAPLAAELILSGGKLMLSGSGEDTFVAVGGRTVQDQAVVRSGDVLSVGEAEFTLRFPV